MTFEHATVFVWLPNSNNLNATIHLCFLKERGMVCSRYLSGPHTIDFDMSDTMSANLSVSELVNSIMHMCLQHRCRRQSRQQRCKFSRKVCKDQTRRRRNWCTNSDMCIRIYRSIRWRSRQTNGCVLFVCTTTNSPDRSLIKINSLAQFILYSPALAGWLTDSCKW